MSAHSTLNSVGRNGTTTTMSIPLGFIKEQAKRYNISIDEFRKTFHAVIIYNDVELHVRFERNG
jgi:hypothetical protein